MNRASAARRRHAWLDLVTPSGPFLTVPVVDRVFPSGMPRISTAVRGALRPRIAEMLDHSGANRHAVIEYTLADVLDWGDRLRLRNDIPAALSQPVPEYGQTIRPDFGFCDDESWKLFGIVIPWGTDPLARTSVNGWQASPVERLAYLLRARNVPIGLVTDGRRWALVWAPVGGTTGAAVFDAGVWSDEPESLDAFVALLCRYRFLSVAEQDALPAMFTQSLAAQEEVTETLGRQVRAAVETLVSTLDRLDAESNGRLLAGVGEDTLYDGVVTVMMRVIFLLFAEERHLLPSDENLYVTAYSVSKLVDQLEDRATVAGEQTLEHRTGAWHRLLAVTRALHQGVAHEDLRLPAYGGGLFDPDRYPWLEGRTADSGPDATPPAVDDRTVLRILRAVQFIDLGPDEGRRRLTFRALDVEQIGYVYEGLLELEVRTATEPMLGMGRPTRVSGGMRVPVSFPLSIAPKEVTLDTNRLIVQVPLAEAEEWLSEAPAELARRVAARVDATKSTVEKALAVGLNARDRDLVRRAVDGDGGLIDAIVPFGPVLRRDERGVPSITLPGRRYIAPSARRATTGTHYTPRPLAEEMADNTLEPLVYRPGPLQTSDRSAWRIRSSADLLGLRVADIAMGSGAFLVAACRYLADRLVDAWIEEGRHDALIAERRRARGAGTDDTDIELVALDARRRVAEHCLYGVDINPLAVEMAKLSLWLVTMDTERPFGFLDDRLVCGDSLLGLASIEQLEHLHIRPESVPDEANSDLFDVSEWRPMLAQAADLRRKITAAPVVTIRDTEHKRRLLTEAEELSGQLEQVADAITGTGLRAAAGKPKDVEAAFVCLQMHVRQAFDGDPIRLVERVESLQTGRPEGANPRVPLHWPLEFPEIFVDTTDPGFDAIVGNPPFLGGQRLSGVLGKNYLAWLQLWDGNGVKGSADLAARFVLRAERLLNSRGQLGYIATNTLTQGDTLAVGMAQATERGLHVNRGRTSHPWPSSRVNLEIVQFWATMTEPGPKAERLLDGTPVTAIGPDLIPAGRVSGRPLKLDENDDVAFIGSYVLGLGFTLTPDQAAELIINDPRNKQALQRYATGQDLNQRADCSPSRWVINFRDWPLERAELYPDLLDILIEKVKPERDKNPERSTRELWWQFSRGRPELYNSISGLSHVLALSLVSNVVMPVRVPAGPVFAHVCGVFALDDFASLAVLSSSVHRTWVIRYASTMRTDIRYTTSDVFDTFPRPKPTVRLSALGERLDAERRELMLGRQWGLTTTYNHVHDPGDRDPAIQGLREIHAQIDHAMLAAYGWSDLDPEIGHHETTIGTRWTVSPAARLELLDRLLEENHRRAESEHS